jgi:peptidoglycan/LPS O-acetylase OafA/YrhL
MTQTAVPTGPRHAAKPARHKPSLRGDIEGLRAVAVLLVLLYHLGFSAFSGGFAGVDVFFVISGFLITSHLLSEVEATGTVRLGRFYARRARRLLPAATVVLVFTGVVGYLVLPQVEHRNLATDVFLAAVYVVNWGFAARSVDYLAEDADVSPLQHYWSLSVEEQFYLVVPVLLILVGWWAARRHLPARRTAGWLVLALALSSFAWSVWHTATSAQTAYFVTTTRVWELAAGSLLACLLPVLTRLGRWTAEALAAAGLALLAWTAFVTTTSTPWPGSAAALPVVGTALVIAAGCSTQSTMVGRLLGVWPMVWVGGLSYAIYLWHWPLIVFADALDLAGRDVTLALLALTLVMAVASRHLVEDPIRFGTALAGPPWRALTMGAVGMAVSTLTAATVWSTVPELGDRPDSATGAAELPRVPPVPAARPDPARPDTGGPATEEPGTGAPQPTFATTGPVHPDPNVAPDDVPRVYADGCQTPQQEVEVNLGCVYGDPDSDTVVAVVGDSKMAQWMSPLIAIAEAEGWRLETYLKSACGLNPALEATDYPECVEWIGRVVDHLTSEPGRVDVVIGSMGKSRSSTSADDLDAYVEGHLSTWATLEQAGATVVALTDTPNPVAGDLVEGDSVYECVAAHREDWSGCAFTRNEGVGTEAILAAAERMPSVEVIDLNPWICPADRCPPVIGEVLVYRQGSHITDTYARTLQEHLWRALVDIGVAAGPPRPEEPS